MKYSNLFEDEENIKCFMQVIREFSNLVIDQEDEDMTSE